MTDFDGKKYVAVYDQFKVRDKLLLFDIFFKFRLVQQMVMC